MHEQRHRLATGAGELRSEPVELLGLARKAGVHDQRIEPDEIPAGGFKLPVVFAEQGEKNLPVLFGGRLRRSRADRRRVVADVMIAGQVTTGDRKRIVQRSGEFEIVAAGRSIEGEIAAVDDEIGAPGVDIFAHPMKVVGQFLMAAGKMGVGNLGEAKFGHATFLPADYISARRRNGDDLKSIIHLQLSWPAKGGASSIPESGMMELRSRSVPDIRFPRV